MNVRLQYELEFMGGIYYEDRLQLNQYSVSLQLLTQTTDALQTNIAMERLKAFVLMAMWCTRRTHDWDTRMICLVSLQTRSC